MKRYTFYIFQIHFYIMRISVNNFAISSGYLDMSPNSQSQPRPDTVPSFLTDNSTDEEQPRRSYSFGNKHTKQVRIMYILKYPLNTHKSYTHEHLSWFIKSVRYLRSQYTLIKTWTLWNHKNSIIFISKLFNWQKTICSIW